jgi:hypothetical protein
MSWSGASFAEELRITDTPKSTPYFLPDVRSSVGITVSCVVPGRTVLRITTTW